MAIKRFVIRKNDPGTPEAPINLTELKNIFDKNVSLFKCDWASDEDKTLQIKNPDSGNVILDIKLQQFKKEVEDGYKDGYGLTFTVHILNGDTITIPKNINNEIANTSNWKTNSGTLADAFATIFSKQSFWDSDDIVTYDKIARKYNCIPEIIISGKSVAISVMNYSDSTVYVRSFLIITKTKKNELAVISSLLTPEKVDKISFSHIDTSLTVGNNENFNATFSSSNSCFCLTNNSALFDVLFFEDVTPQSVYEAELMTMNPILVNGDNDYCTNAYFTYFSQLKNTTCSMLIDNKRYYYNGYVVMPES